MRWIVGSLLIGAAVLKGLDIYQHPSSLLGESFRWFLMPIQVGGELGLGLFAIAGLYWRLLYPVAMLVFAGFGCYSLLLALQGAKSCGCFGQLEISPWWTFLLDIIVFAGLAIEFITKRRDKYAPLGPHSVPATTLVVGTMLLSLAVSVGLAWHVAPRKATSQNWLQAVGNLIILEPETWQGQKFPLANYLDINVSQGNWVLLMHHHDCPKCQVAIPRYEKLAMLEPSKLVALIELPPYNTSHVMPSGHCYLGRLSDDHEWFVETPVEIQLVDGFVKRASTELASIHE